MAGTKRLTCPECWSEDQVEKVKVATPAGKDATDALARGTTGWITRSKLSKIRRNNQDDSLHVYRCLSCGYHELWDIKQRQRRFKGFVVAAPATGKDGAARDAGTSPAGPRVSNRQKELAHAIFLASVFTVAGVATIAGLGVEPADPLVVAVVSAAFVLAFVGFSYGILRLVDKHVHWLRFTLQVHQFLYGKHLYYLEQAPKKEKVSFSASVKRSLFGSLLIFGIYIIIVENFLIIPDLKQYFWVASYVTLVTLAGALPFIMVWLYVSPLLTKEANLYYFDKKDRIVRNIGSWLDDALKFFAAIDIILTTIIIIDSGLDVTWFGLIMVFLFLIFSFFIVFTVVFNRFYHSRLKEKFIEYLKGSFNLPVKKATVLHHTFHCLTCGASTDAVQENTCPNCKSPIFKCEICNEVIMTTTVLGKNPKDFPRPGTRGDKVSSLVHRMEAKLASGSGTSKEYPAIQCPECGILAHFDEYVSWIKMHKTCPGCKRDMNVFDIF